MTVQLPLPRNVQGIRLASGEIGYYWYVPTKFRKQGCKIPNEPLGTNYVVACGEDGKGGRAAACNSLFDEWRRTRGGESIEGIAKHGTVDWLFREYKSSVAYQERVSKRTRPDYERTMLLLADFKTKRGDRIGNRKIRAITPVSADKLYSLIADGRPRQREKLIALCRRAWSVVHRLHPDLFDRDVPNPWTGVTKKRRTMKTKLAANREQVYTFAWAAIERGYPEAAAAAVIAFEFLQRPENILAGFIRWNDFRGAAAPNAIKIEHHRRAARCYIPLRRSLTASGSNSTRKRRPS